MTETLIFEEKKYKPAILRIYLLLAVISGVYTIGSVVRIPGETNSSVIFGLSRARLLLSGSILVVIIIAAWLLVKSFLQKAWFYRLTNQVVARVENKKIWGSTLILCILGLITGTNFVLFTTEITEPVTLAYYVRLQPVALWVAIICALTLLTIHILREGFTFLKSELKSHWVKSAIIILTFFMLLWIWISRTGIGLSILDQGVGWNPLGSSITQAQVILAWGVTVAFFSIWSWVVENPPKIITPALIHSDLTICIILWTVAFCLWNSQPLLPNWFASEPRPPNFEYYPNRDASVYDITAQNLLLGEGFKTRGSPFTIRPLYGMFLAGAHLIGGLSYEDIIWIQVAVLALIPVFLYSTTRLIHNRVSGVLAASLFILRENSAIRFGDVISVAHAKLLMPFLPTTFGVLLFLWVIIAWLRNPSKNGSLPLVSGGLLGIFMLIRPEFIVFLPFVGLAALLQLRKYPTLWRKGLVLISLGLVLALGPWVWRNYQLTGTLFIDSPHYRLDLFARRYRDEPLGYVIPGEFETPIPTSTSSVIEENPDQIPISPTSSVLDQKGTVFDPDEIAVPTLVPNGEPTATPDIFPEPNESIQNYSRRVVGDVTRFFQENPSTVPYLILNHFMNSSIQTILNLPDSYPITYSFIKSLGHKSASQFWQDCCTGSEYSRLPYWHKWDGDLLKQTFIPLFINIILLSTGIAVSWKQGKFIGLVPIFAATGYYLINAIVRNSGGRYIIPVNWIGILYFSIGLIQITLGAISFYKKTNLSTIDDHNIQNNDEGKPYPMWHIKNLGIAVGFLFLGMTLPLVEKHIPLRQDENVLESRLFELYNSAGPIINQAESVLLENFISNQGKTMAGIALYPRYNESGQDFSEWFYNKKRSYSYLDFYLSSPHDNGIILPIEDSPDYFPHATSVLVFVCPDMYYSNALAVVLYTEDGQPIKVIWRSPMPETPGCPLNPPHKMVP